MRTATYAILLLLVMCACSSKEASHITTVKNYYSGFNNGDYKLVETQLLDSITITEGDYVMNFTPETFETHFKWDSVFVPRVKIINIEQQENDLLVTISASSKRFEFLRNNPLVTKHLVHFTNGKISRIDNVDFINTDWKLWTEQKEGLTQWIANNHEELDGFMIDQTLQGGLNYLKAIDLYTNRESNSTKTLVE
ncbi:hypothetical protein [uncultured Dokdonia sp.]|uniref:hypothetical protein n=1 Tax=uncultured Dokdonia sp. TaxID=575653 RepID=UPI00261BA594|nr:hypothetical protein [uncultured Dokdonia sp.]